MTKQNDKIKTWIVIAITTILLTVVIKFMYFNDNNSKDYSPKPLQVRIILDSSQNGFVQNVYFNSRIESEGKLIDGKKDSIWNYYSEFGKLTSKVSFHLGEKHGSSISFHPNGNISEILHYTNDLPDGEWIKFGEDGKTVLLKAKYENAKLEGRYNVYFDDGKIEGEYVYSNGVKNGKYVGYDVNSEGKSYIRQTGSYKNNLEEGEWKTYEYYNDLKDNTIGKKLILVFQGNYRNGKYHGISIDYHAKYGFKLIETHYIDGVENGTRKSYCPSGVDRGRLYIVEEIVEGEAVSKKYYCKCNIAIE